MKKYQIQFFSLLIGLVLLWPASNNNWGGNNWVDILESDAKGYYAYLPAFLIHKDINFGHFDEYEKGKYYNENIYYDYRFSFNGKVVNKYFVGTSILQLPFFYIAHVYATHSDKWDADGFSKPYLVAINIAAIFYLTLGIFLLLKVLVPKYGSVAIVISGFSVYATNLFYYAVNEPGMSHVYSFFLVCGFIFSLLKFEHFGKPKYLFITAVILGFLFLIRPVNCLIVLSIPFILGREKSGGILNFVKLPKNLLIIGLSFLAIVSIQFVIYYFQTGNFLVYSYGEEGFNWSNPQILNALFSFKKGAFIYTPILWLIFPALGFLWKRDKFKFNTFLIFIIPVLYVFYSWWNWWYGGSFSQRVLIEYYPFLILIMAMWLSELNSPKVKKLILGFSIICLILGQYQTFQYRHNIIHWEDMNSEKYFEVLFRMPD